MGFVSKMSVLKVLEVVWEVSGLSGKVGFWSPRALAHFRKFLEIDLGQSPMSQMTISHFQKFLTVDHMQSANVDRMSTRHRC